MKDISNQLRKMSAGSRLSTATPGGAGRIAAVVVVAGLVLAGCGSSGGSAGSTSGSASAGAGTLRLGYFANVTHAAAVLGVADGSFQKALGATKLETQVFNAGPAAIEALNAGAIDAAFLGPSPAINAYAKSGGKSLRIVAGATDNGAELVVKPEITSAAALKGRSIATPQLGGTQDVALRSYLGEHGLKTQTNGGSDVDVVNQDNSQTLDLFRSGQVDGVGCPNRGRHGWFSTPAPRSWWTRRPCGPPSVSRRRCWWSPRRSWTPTPTWCGR